MKRINLILLIMTLVIISLQAQDVKKVAMLEPVGEASKMQKAIIRAKLAESLTNSGKYEALTRTDVDQILNEGNFQKGGMVSDAQRKKLGQMSGAELLCITRLTLEDGYFFVESSLIQMESGKIEKTDNQLMTATPVTELEKGCLLLASKLAGVSINSSSLTLKTSEETTSETVSNGEYALLHIYRLPKAVGALMNYNIHIDKEVICRASNNWKTTVKVSTFGIKTLWAKTETKEEVSVDLVPGGVYYLRCSIKMGVLTGRPTLELVDNSIGESEFNSITKRVSIEIFRM